MSKVTELNTKKRDNNNDLFDYLLEDVSNIKIYMRNMPDPIKFEGPFAAELNRILEEAILKESKKTVVVDTTIGMRRYIFDMNSIKYIESSIGKEDFIYWENECDEDLESRGTRYRYID